MGEKGINYKRLLKKYVNYVAVSEGIDFIDPIEHLHEFAYGKYPGDESLFTDVEWAELLRISSEKEY